MNVTGTDFAYITNCVRDAVKGVMANPSKNITEVCKKWEKDDLQNMPLEDLFRGLRTIYSNAAHHITIDLINGEIYNVDGDRISRRAEVAKLFASLASDMGTTTKKVQSVVDSQLLNKSKAKIDSALGLIEKLKSLYEFTANAAHKIAQGNRPSDDEKKKADALGKEIAKSLMELEKSLTDDFKSQERF